MEIITQDPAPGKLLISEPFLPDPNFSRSVVLLTDHNKEGSVGFILNRPLKTQVSEVLKGFEGIQAPLYLGGPVQLDTLHFVHRCPESVEGIPLGQDMYWGGDLDLLRDGLKSKIIPEDGVRFFLGYSGWGQGQLLEEIGQNSWIVCNGDADLVFKERSERSWQNILKTLGHKFAVLANFPQNPSLN